MPARQLPKAVRAAVPLRRPTIRRRSMRLSQLLPSARSLLVAAALLVLGVGLYFGARETSVFAIRTIEVTGAPGPVADDVREALGDLSGSSLVVFDRVDGDRRLAGVPYVASATYDRDFPNTLRVAVQPERPIATLRRGHDAWLVSDRARVLEAVETRPLPRLPTIWLPKAADPLVGTALAGATALVIRVLVPVMAADLPAGVRSARLVDGEVSIVLTNGVEVLLGEPFRLRLKLAVLARILPLARDAGYVDVSVPERAVAGSTPIANPQVEG